MVLPVEFEILIPLVLAFFFSLLYETDTDNQKWAGLIAMVLWLCNMLLWLIISSYPVTSLVFMAIWILYVIRLLIGFFKPLEAKQKKRMEGDTD
ncbi:hypothetical protein MUP59_00415 [Candidatus Bathyarchaeota archaeon]|nr:hypothetical protein [Candidatus Bathyarchaeota archaeon]